jgi:hydroxyethylthiazole kinase
VQFNKIITRIKKEKPLVHHITNWVTIYDCANITLAFGALPVMAHAREEVEEMAGIASALVLNIGTLTPELVDSMVLAAKKANEKRIPVVLDAVGAGATKLRTQKALEIIEKTRVDIIKGNSSEIATLAGAKAQTRGVEAGAFEGNPLELAKKLALQTSSVVVITGKEDIISNGKKSFLIKNGHESMGTIVGTGCMATSVIACFAASEKDYAIAAASALSAFGIAGELAAQKSKGSGSFKQCFYDAVSMLDEKKISEMQKIEEA